MAIRVAIELFRGWLFLVVCRARGMTIEGGKGLRIEGRLVARGKGKLVLGDNIRVAMKVTPWTYHPDAVIRIGDNTFLNGTRFGCAREISIGRNCILADARIMDTDFHSLHANRSDPDAPVRVKPVRLEDNVWVGAQAGILPGTKIGKNSVVAFGAVCSGKYRANAVILGNPAEVAMSIPSVTTDEAGGSDDETD